MQGDKKEQNPAVEEVKEAEGCDEETAEAIVEDIKQKVEDDSV